ncbi:MAG: glucosaminidase domain-containing protein [Alcanivoracaceae bacterium]|nr:glucosaminidase domain-containing protein [Alcanivoracaceae bacterium]
MARKFVWRVALVLTLSTTIGTAAWLLQSYLNRPPPPIWPIPEDPTEARKANMINVLLPLIQKNNRRLLEQRKYATELEAKVLNNAELDNSDMKWLASMGKRYRLAETEDYDKQWMQILLRRLDIIPADLALAQAAMESAWGESRFAQEGSNFFGQWCFKKGCGIVPGKRPADATYEVQSFDSPAESVRLYMRNLNSHPRYAQLRIIREQARAKGEDIEGQALAAGLHGYSAIGDTYIHTLRALIRANQFQQFPSY